MKVQIPQMISDYEPTIVWGLRRRQLIYAIAAVLAIVIINLQFDFVPFIARLILSIFMAALTLAFMFLNLGKWVDDELAFGRAPKNVGFLDAQAQAFLDIADIRDGTVFLKNGDLKAVIRVQPVNFTMLDEKQQGAIFEAFKNFLDSLSGSSSSDLVPIQILVKTNHLDLNNFFANTKAQAAATNSKALAGIASHFEKFFREHIAQENTIYRTFNIVVSLSKNSTPSTAKDAKGMRTQLEQRVNICMEKLRSVGLVPKRLGDDELLGLYASFFSPLPLVSSEYLEPLTVAKGWQEKWKETAEEMGRVARAEGLKADYKTPTAVLNLLLSPSYINTTRDHLRVNDKFYRTVVVVGYPDIVSPGFLEPLITARGIFHVSMHIQPTNFANTIDYYNKMLEKQSLDIATDQASGKLVAYSQSVQCRATQELIDMLARGSERAFSCSIYLLVEADSLERLNLLTDAVVAKLNEVRLKPVPTYNKMDLAFKSVAPLGYDALGAWRNMTSSSAAACFPFVSAFFEPQPSGIMFGENQLDGMPLICDLFSKNFSNANGLVLGTSGGGKSFAVKTVVKRGLQQGVDVLVLDPSDEGEYGAMAGLLGGSVIEFSEASKAFINPFDIKEQSLEEKYFFLHGLMRFFISNMTDEVRDLLDEAFETVYARRGITKDPKSWGKTPPLLSDLYDLMEEERKNSNGKRAEAATAVATSLRRFVKGSYSFINKHTHIENLDNRFVVFRVGSLPRDVRRILMFIVLEYVYNKMKKDLRRKFLVIDEAWKLLQTEGEEGYVLNIVKTCRHHNMGLILLTQDVYDLVSSKAGKAVMANTSWQLLLRMKPAVIEDVAATFRLNDTAKNYLLTVEPGSGLIFINNTFIPLKNIVDDEEYKMFTTHPEDLARPG